MYITLTHVSVNGYDDSVAETSLRKGVRGCETCRQNSDYIDDRTAQIEDVN